MAGKKKIEKAVKKAVAEAFSSGGVALFEQPSSAVVPSPSPKLSKDLKLAAQTMTDDEARFLVTSFYKMQDQRIRTDNQARSLSATHEPHEVLAWFSEQSARLEDEVQKALDSYTSGLSIGRWLKRQTGIGPIIAAGLLAHLRLRLTPPRRIDKLEDLPVEFVTAGQWYEPDAEKGDLVFTPPEDAKVPSKVIRYVGQWWRFAGYDPTVVWEKGKKRPWNAQLKVLLFKLGESFIKFQANSKCYYGQAFAIKKAAYINKNKSGHYVTLARKTMDTRNIGKTTEAWAWYKGCYPGAVWDKLLTLEPTQRAAYLKKERLKEGEGLEMLPPGRINAMSRRWAVKLFLSHFHRVWYQYEFDQPAPLPWIITHGGHDDIINVYDWPFAESDVTAAQLKAARASVNKFD